MVARLVASQLTLGGRRAVTMRLQKIKLFGRRVRYIQLCYSEH